MSAKTVTVSILDKDYQVSCGPNEVSALLESAQYLDGKMREVKDGSNVLGLDRIAVMAALNIANEYLSEADKGQSLAAGQSRDLELLSRKVDSALNRFKQGSN